MPPDLRGRCFLKELDYTPEEWDVLLHLAEDLKAAKRNGTETPRLTGKTIALVFEKASTRTRCAFEVAAYDQGARVTYLDPAGSHLGHKESIEDTARVLGRMFDGIEFRGSEHRQVERLAAVAGVPVWNGLTSDWHPTQSLCDVLTMREHGGKGPDAQISVAYLGDARNNVASSLVVAGAMMGMDVRVVAPTSRQCAGPVLAAARHIGEARGATITQTQDPAEGVHGVDFIYTDVWLSMGEAEESWTDRINQLLPYQVTMDLLAASGNPNVKFMHCLPALHDLQTSLGQTIHARTGLTCLEVSDEVFRSPHSIVFDQAENRLHTIKAIMVATLVG